MATYYMAPTGSDANDGSSGSPKLTFAHVIGLVAAGDTIILKDGSYTDANSGHPSISSKSGTSGSRITMRAENERQASIYCTTGLDETLYMMSSNYWTFEGIYFRNADGSGGSAGDVAFVQGSSYNIFRKCVFAFNNRYTNSNLLVFYSSSNYNLMEDCEGYSFHRIGFGSLSSSYNVFRRCYLNSRARADVGGGYVSGFTGRGDEAFTVYPGSENIVENCISEGNGIGFNIEASGTAQLNKFLGCISINDDYGILFKARGATTDLMPYQNQVTDTVVISPNIVGVYLRGNRITNINNVSIFGDGSTTSSLFLADKEGGGFEGVNGERKIYSKNTMVLNGSAVAGFAITTADVDDWTLNYNNSYGNANNWSPVASDIRITNELEGDPVNGTCYCWIKDASPNYGAGLAGAHVGATVLYQYVNGAITATKLWDTTTYKFAGIGALISGLNDSAGDSLTNVSERLNINQGGCSFPAGYGPGGGGGGTSNYWQYASVVISSGLVPTISAVTPGSIAVGGPAFTLTVNGGNFVNGAVVQWNGANRATTFVSSTQLTAAILAADIVTLGSAQVRVVNP